MLKLTAKRVLVDDELWLPFLNMTYDCFAENWSSRISGQNISDFHDAYGDILRRRSAESVRGLFLYSAEGAKAGLSNVYLDENSSGTKRLNVAEFYVVPNFRHKGLGTQMLQHIVNWGKTEGAETIRLEVDKDLLDANQFWSKFDFKLNESGDRNVYTKDFSTKPKLKNVIT